MSVWLNTIEPGCGFVFTDHQGGVGQFYVVCGVQSSTFRTLMRNAALDICVGNPINRDLRPSNLNLRNFTIDVSDPNQNVKNKWLVTGLNTLTNETERFYIPCADASLLTPGSDSVDLADPNFVPLVDALEAYWRRPAQDVEDTMSILSIQFTGGE